MAKLVNRARMTTATTGTGTLTLGAATAGYQSFAAAGIVTGDQIRYVIEDGTNWEIGLGTYTASGPTLSRGPVASSSAGAAIPLTGSAVVFVTAVAEDIARPTDVQIFTTPGTSIWAKPDGARSVDVVVIAGGGGGGSGRKGAAGTVAGGGGGGVGGSLSFHHGFPASALPATVTVTVGDGGAGGAAVTANSSNGNGGGFGGASNFGPYLGAGPGWPGNGGTTTGGLTGGNSNRGMFAPNALGGAGGTGTFGQTGGGSYGGAAGGGGGRAYLPPSSTSVAEPAGQRPVLQPTLQAGPGAGPGVLSARMVPARAPMPVAPAAAAAAAGRTTGQILPFPMAEEAEMAGCMAAAAAGAAP